uniref:Uncharacterized protein n=1 Tax=viral metagenome TaxID=1070528 RepID=A0A6C0H036_9ZZZZ
MITFNYNSIPLQTWVNWNIILTITQDTPISGNIELSSNSNSLNFDLLSQNNINNSYNNKIKIPIIGINDNNGKYSYTFTFIITNTIEEIVNITANYNNTQTNSQETNNVNITFKDLNAEHIKAITNLNNIMTLHDLKLETLSTNLLSKNKIDTIHTIVNTIENKTNTVHNLATTIQDTTNSTINKAHRINFKLINIKKNQSYNTSGSMYHQ